MNQGLGPTMIHIMAKSQTVRIFPCKYKVSREQWQGKTMSTVWNAIE